MKMEDLDQFVNLPIKGMHVLRSFSYSANQLCIFSVKIRCLLPTVFFRV